MHEKQPELEAYIAKWQKILNIEQWVVHSKLLPTHQMDSLDHFGYIVVYAAHEIAEIQIITPDTYDWIGKPYDMEAIVLHELLHIVMGTEPVIYQNDQKYEREMAIAFELGLNRTRDALLRLDRKSRRQKILNIEQWVVHSKLLPTHQMDSLDHFGYIVVYAAHEIAEIQIITPDTYDWIGKPYDMEAIVLHELLHIVMGTEPVIYQNDQKYEREMAIAFELGLNRTRDALLRRYIWNKGISRK